MLSFSNPDSIAKLKPELKTVRNRWEEVMSIARKLIGSGSLLAAFVLTLCLAVPAPCAAASAADRAVRAGHRLAAVEDPVDLPEILIPKPPPPPPARAAAPVPPPAVEIEVGQKPPESPKPSADSAGEGSRRVWLWAAIGVLVTGAAVAGGYFYFRPSEPSTTGTLGGYRF
jgi:hypothetical protein